MNRIEIKKCLFNGRRFKESDLVLTECDKRVIVKNLDEIQRMLPASSDLKLSLSKTQDTLSGSIKIKSLDIFACGKSHSISSLILKLKIILNRQLELRRKCRKEQDVEVFLKSILKNNEVLNGGIFNNTKNPTRLSLIKEI